MKKVYFFLLFSLILKTISGQWQQVGNIPSLSISHLYTCLDKNGYPTMVYRDSYASTRASVLKFNGVIWQNIGSLGFTNSNAKGTTLAFNRNNIPFVAFVEGNYSGRASVMAYKEGSWNYVGPSAFTPYSASFISLCFSDSGTLYMAFRDFMYGARASVMKFDGMNWQYVGKPGFSAGNTNSLVPSGAAEMSLKFSPQGVLYLSYLDQPNDFKASVMKFKDTAWVYVGNPGFSAGAANSTSLDFDSVGAPHVAYTDGGNGSKATVMKFNGTDWESIGTVGFTQSQVSYTSLKFNRNTNTPYISFMDHAKSQRASVMKYDGISWEYIGKAGFSNFRAWHTSLDIDSVGNLYVGYEDEDSTHLQPVVMKYINENTVGLKKETIENGLHVYPNPTEKFISICYKSNLKSDNLELKIKNTIGQCIYSKSCKIPGAELNERIDLSHFPKGIYFIQISTGNATEVRKIVLE